MATSTKNKVIGKKPTIINHECLHEDKFSELDKRTKETHNIITGNGTPENGLIVQMVKVNLTQTEILKTLTKLDNSIDSLSKKYDESIETANSAKHAVEAYKKEMEAFDEGKESEQAFLKAKNERVKMLSDLQHTRYTRWITTISVVIAALALLYNVFIKEDKSTALIENKIDNLGVPVVVNKRTGKLQNLSDSLEIKMFNLNSDSINTNN